VRAAALLCLGLAAGCAVEAEVWDPVPGPGEGPAFGPEWPPDRALPPEFDTPPWLTMPVPGTVTVGWQTAAATTARLELEQVSGGSLSLSVREEAPAVLHRVRLGPLPPASGFRYRVTLDRSGAAREGVFATPGAPAWRFIHLGEFHAPSELDEVARFAGAIRAFRPNLAVESGDMVDDGDDPGDWRAYLRASRPWISNVILLPAHSNHVTGFLGNTGLLDRFDLPGNGRWYATRWGRVEFLTLDSTYDGDSPDVAEEPGWVRAQMAEARDGDGDPGFVVGAWHYPACSSHYASRAEQRGWVIEELLPAFRDAGGLDLILVGHDKYYERSLVDDGERQVPHVMANIGRLSPGGEGDNAPACSPQVTRTDTRSLVLVQVGPDALAAQVIEPGGGEIDRFSLPRRDEPAQGSGIGQ
jgi:hypothetical protein